MARCGSNQVGRLRVLSAVFRLMILCLVFEAVSSKEFPAASEDSPATKKVVEEPLVDTKTGEKQESDQPQPSETGPGLERDTDDPQDIVHTRESLKNMNPGPGVQWRLTMPVPLEETQPDLRRKRRNTDTSKRLLKVAREAHQGDDRVPRHEEASREPVYDKQSFRESGDLMRGRKSEGIPWPKKGQKIGSLEIENYEAREKGIKAPNKLGEAGRMTENGEIVKAHGDGESQQSKHGLTEISLIIDIANLGEKEKVNERKGLKSGNITSTKPEEENLMERPGVQRVDETDMKSDDHYPRQVDKNDSVGNFSGTKNANKEKDHEIGSLKEGHNEEFAIPPLPPPVVGAKSFPLWQKICSWVEKARERAELGIASFISNIKKVLTKDTSVSDITKAHQVIDDDTQILLNINNNRLDNRPIGSTTSTRENAEKGSLTDEGHLYRVKRRSRRRRKHHRLGKRDTITKGLVSPSVDQLHRFNEAKAGREIRMEQDGELENLERVKRRSRRRRKHHRLGKRSFSDNGLEEMDLETKDSVGEVRGDEVAEIAERVKRSRRRRKHHKLGKRSLFDKELVGFVDETNDNVSVVAHDAMMENERVDEVAERVKRRSRRRRKHHRLRKRAIISPLNVVSDTHEKLKDGGSGHKILPLSMLNSGDITEVVDEASAEKLLSGDRLLSRIVREALETVGSGVDEPIESVSGGDDVDANIDVDDVDSGGVVESGDIDEAVAAGDGDIGEDVDGLDGAGNELDSETGVELGGGDEIGDVGADDLDNAVAYNENEEIGEELSGGDEIPGEAGVDLAPSVADVGDVDSELDGIPPDESLGSVPVQKIEVSNEQKPVVTGVSNRKGKKVKAKGKKSKKLRVKAGKGPTLQEIEQEDEYEEQSRKLHRQKQVQKKTTAEIRRKVEGSTDEIPHPKKLSKVMKDKKAKAAYKRILNKDSVKKQAVDVKPESERVSGDDDLAKTMHRLEEKVDTVKSMIESGLRKQHPKKKVHGSKHGHKHKRSVNDHSSLEGSASKVQDSIAMLKPKAKLSPNEEKSIIMKSTPFIKSSSQLKSTKRPISSSLGDDQRPISCDDCVSKESMHEMKGNILEIGQHSPPLQKTRDRKHIEKKERNVVIIPLQQTDKKKLRLSSKGHILVNNSGPEGLLEEGVVSMSIPIFTPHNSGRGNIQKKNVNKERSDQTSKSHRSPGNTSDSPQSNIKLQQNELHLKSLFSLPPEEYYVSAIGISPPSHRSVHTQISPLHTILPPVPSDKGWLGEKKNGYSGLPPHKNKAISAPNVIESLEKAGLLQSFKRENPLHSINVHKIVDDMTADTIQHVQNVLRNLRAWGKNNENRFMTKGKDGRGLKVPFVYKTPNKNNKWHRLVNERFGERVGRTQMPEDGKAAEVRVKELLKHILQLQTLERLAHKRAKPIVLGRSSGTKSGPLESAWQRLVEEMRKNLVKVHGTLGSEIKDPRQYPQSGSVPSFVEERKSTTGRGFGRAPQNGLTDLKRAVERLSSKADMIEKRFSLDIGKGFRDGLNNKFMHRNKAFKIPDKNIFLHTESRKPPIDFSTFKVPHESQYKLMLLKNDAKLKQLEGLVKFFIRTLCRHRKRRLRRLRDLSWSHWMDEKEKEKNRQKQGIKPEKDPVSEEELELERQLKDLLARFPMSQAEYAMNNNMRKEDSKIAAATDILKAVIARASDAAQELPVMGTSSVLSWLSNIGRKRRHVKRSVSGAQLHVTEQTRQTKSPERNMNLKEKLVDRSKHDLLKKPKPVFDQNYREQKASQFSRKQFGKIQLKKNFGPDKTVSPITTIPSAAVHKPKITNSPLKETNRLESAPQEQQVALKRTKKQAMKKELPYGFGMLFGADPDYFEGDFNEINEYDDYEGEENLLRRRLIGTPPYMSGYYMHSELFPGFYTYHPPGVYKRSVDDHSVNVPKRNVDDHPTGVSKQSVDDHPNGVSKQSVDDHPTGVSKRSVDDHPTDVSKQSLEDHPTGVTKKSVSEQPQSRSQQKKYLQKLLMQQQQQQQEQQRYDDFDLDDSAVDEEDYEDEEDLDDYEEDEDDETDVDDDDDDDDEDNDENQGEGDDVGKIQVEDNGELVEPDDQMVYVVKKSETNQKVEEPLSWGAWSVCSVTCGLGQRYRVSICGEDGEPCHGRRASEEMEVCQVHRSC